MAISLSSPVTGSTQTGLTSPTFTMTVDTSPAANIKQWAVTALGGTQTGVSTSSMSSPFTISFSRPVNFKQQGTLNTATGLLRSVPKNAFRVISRKGVSPLAGQPAAIMPIITSIEVPAGADLADPLSVRAALSLHIGALQQLSDSLGLLVVTGNL